MSSAAPPSSWEQIRPWRQQTRQQLIEQRMAAPAALRLEQGAAAKRHLLAAIDLRPTQVLGIYWPMRAEMDVRDIARSHIEAGGVVGLPVVVEKSAPVEFWRWQPGMPMDKGIWDIPVPAERIPLHPHVLIIPLVGFDAQCYRLGYGGGYYDRTIAAAAPRPLCVGLGFAAGELATIHPQPHDIPMRLVATELGLTAPRP